MLLSRLIWPKKIFCFINKCSFKSSPRSAYYVTVTPYGPDIVLFHPPHGGNSQKTIFSQAAQRAASETCRGVAGINKHWLSGRVQLRFPWSRNTPQTRAVMCRSALKSLTSIHHIIMQIIHDKWRIFHCFSKQQLINKLNPLGLNNSLCNWILDFLTGRPQSVRVGHNTSSTTTLSTGAPQGRVLSPLLFTLLTHDCTAKFSSNHIIKFADDTTVVGSYQQQWWNALQRGSGTAGWMVWR